jgi:pimeloyl-ACP methyl ester carboxylesterase
MEKQLRLKTKDGFIIHGTLTRSPKKARGLVIFVHGLTGHKNEHYFYNGASHFAKHGFDTFRFDLYSWEKGSRRLSRCTTKTHAEDLNRVTAHFLKKYKKLHVVGHSLGTTTIFLSDTSKFSSIVLWDPSMIDELIGLVDKKIYEPKLKSYVLDWGVDCLIGKAMHEEWRRLPSLFDLVSAITQPIKIIIAEKGVGNKAKKYFERANKPKSLTVLKGVGHTFDEEGAEEKLLKETLRWIERF